MIEILILILVLVGILFSLVIIGARRSVGYIFCNATISAWEARLIPEPRLVELTELPKVENVFSALEESEYKPQLSEVGKTGGLDMIEVERALRENLNERYRELIKMVPKDRRATVVKILQRIDLWNLKALITMIHEKVPPEERLKELISSPTTPRERLEMLASAKDLNELLEFLKGSDLFDVISGALGDYEKRGLIALLSALDRYYYTSLLKDAMARRAQRMVLKMMIGYEIDSVNIKLILRLKREGAPPEEIDRYLIRPSHELTEAMLKAMIMAEDIRSAINMIHITTYGKILTEALPKIEEQGIQAAEKAIDEAYLKLCRWLEFTQFFSIAPVVSYIHLKENEMRNLRAIIRFKTDGFEPRLIKEKIVRVPKVEL